MPSFEHHGAHILYEEFGQGFPILTFAPAGLPSVVDVGGQPPAPIHPTTESLTDRHEATQQLLAAFYRNLYAPGFVYCADRDFVKTIKAPCLVLAGNDEAHPWPISEELSKLIPNCEFVAEWKTEPALTPAKAKATGFLARHTPARA